MNMHRMLLHGPVLHMLLPCMLLSDLPTHEKPLIASLQVPHSLRLQGILIGGVVVVYSRQQGFLLGAVSICKACAPASTAAICSKSLLLGLATC